MDRLRAMRVFVEVAAAGTLSGAARRLDQPLTTVSRQLAALENDLGATLIARTTRRLTLTEEGRVYLETCRHVLSELAEVESQLSGRDRRVQGELSITAPVVFGRLHVLPVVTSFLARYPDLNIRLHLVDRVLDLTEDGFDIAIRVGDMPDSALVATKVGALRTVTCASSAYLRKHGTPQDPRDLVDHVCISFAILSGKGRSWTFRSKAHGQRTVRIDPRLSVSTAEAAIDAVASGTGITRVMSYQAAEALSRKKLVTVLDAFDDTLSPIHVVRREVRRPNPQTRLFAEFAIQELRIRLR